MCFHVFTFSRPRFHGQMCIFTFSRFTAFVSTAKCAFSRFVLSQNTFPKSNMYFHVFTFHTGSFFPQISAEVFSKLCLPKNIGVDINHQLNSFKGVRRPVAEKINWKTIKTTKLTITENTSNLQTFHICSPNQTHIYIYYLHIIRFFFVI